MKTFNYILLLIFITIFFSSCSKKVGDTFVMETKSSVDSVDGKDIRKFNKKFTESLDFPLELLERATGESITVGFVINEKNELIETRVLVSSCSKELDDVVLNAIKIASKELPAFNEEKVFEKNVNITNGFTLSKYYSDENKKIVNDEKIKPYVINSLDNKSVEEDFIVLMKCTPFYPIEAINKKIEGWVNLGFTIDKEGNPKNIEIIDSYPKKIFDNNASYALSRWKFSPIIKDGVTIESKANIIMNFKIHRNKK